MSIVWLNNTEYSLWYFATWTDMVCPIDQYFIVHHQKRKYQQIFRKYDKSLNYKIRGNVCILFTFVCLDQFKWLCCIYSSLAFKNIFWLFFITYNSSSFGVNENFICFCFEECPVVDVETSSRSSRVRTFIFTQRLSYLTLFHTEHISATCIWSHS